jgi:hypothetical protein
MEAFAASRASKNKQIGQAFSLTLLLHVTRWRRQTQTAQCWTPQKWNAALAQIALVSQIGCE